MKQFNYFGCVFSLLLLSGCNPQYTSIEEQTASASCNNNQPCRYDNGIKVWLSDPTIAPESPFSVHVSLPENLQIEQAKLVGVTMYMGFIPLQFKSFQDHYMANTMVGICSEREMTWKLELNVINSQGDSKILLYFFDVIY